MKEKKIYQLFSKLIRLIGNQRIGSNTCLADNYLRPFKERKNFSLARRPENLPFELFAYFRAHRFISLDEEGDDRIDEMF